MTSTYNGLATIVTADGEEFDVQAELAMDGLMRWGGYVAGDEQHLWDMFNAGSVTIRLPDGGEGTIYGRQFGGDRLDVSGSGQPPF